MADTSFCERCNEYTESEIILMESGVHHAKRVCCECGRFQGWQKKDSSTNRVASHRELVRKYGVTVCDLCRRQAAHLPKGETIEAHHVIEYQDGGTDDRENLWFLCTPCHRLVHWRRTYEAHTQSQLEDFRNA